MATEMTTTEETENDGESDERGRESLGTRSREWRRGPQSGCTRWLRCVIWLYEWAGTGSGKQTTETSEETETFCRGYHYGNGHRDDHLATGAGTGSSKQTTETTEETETFCRGYHYGNGHREDHDGGNGNDRDSDERALAREDVSGDVTRSVAERGGYAVSSGGTSGAGTGSSKPTTETSEETETFCRGYHYGNGHRDDHDGGNGKRRRK
ncbi:hypothetical protein PInf_000401 [Phytophthora infestans]|nr:hypothetical protein PInf_000401 [Phytophthora infestans]